MSVTLGMVWGRKPKVFAQKNLLTKRGQMESAVRETLASILSLSFFTRPVKAVRSLYFDRGKVKMNDISAWTRLTLSEHYFPLFVWDNYSKLDPSKSGGNFKGSPSYCRESLSEGAKFDDSKHFRNLDFATTSYGCSTPKLGRKLLETTSNEIHMLTFLKSA